MTEIKYTNGKNLEITEKYYMNSLKENVELECQVIDNRFLPIGESGEKVIRKKGEYLLNKMKELIKKIDNGYETFTQEMMSILIQKQTSKYHTNSIEQMIQDHKNSLHFPSVGSESYFYNENQGTLKYNEYSYDSLIFCWEYDDVKHIIADFHPNTLEFISIDFHSNG